MPFVAIPPKVPVTAPIKSPAAVQDPASRGCFLHLQTFLRYLKQEMMNPPTAPVSAPIPTYWPDETLQVSNAALLMPTALAVIPAAAPPVIAPPRDSIPAFNAL